MNRNEILDAIRATAKRYGVPEDIAVAVAKVESSFNPGAVSKKGALGIMQLMPDTAKELGVSDPLNPGQNIEAGVRYLSDLYRRFGDWRSALAAYNAGPSRVEDYISGKRDLPSETVSYLAKISDAIGRPLAFPNVPDRQQMVKTPVEVDLSELRWQSYRDVFPQQPGTIESDVSELESIREPSQEELEGAAAKFYQAADEYKKMAEDFRHRAGWNLVKAIGARRRNEPVEDIEEERKKLREEEGQLATQFGQLQKMEEELAELQHRKQLAGLLPALATSQTVGAPIPPPEYLEQAIKERYPTVGERVERFGKALGASLLRLSSGTVPLFLGPKETGLGATSHLRIPPPQPNTPRGLLDGLTNPLLPLDQLFAQDPATIPEGIGLGAARGVSGLTSPLNLAIIAGSRALAAIPHPAAKIAGTVLSGFFAAEMGLGTIESGLAAMRYASEGRAPLAAASTTEALINAAFAIGMTRHVANEIRRMRSPSAQREEEWIKRSYARKRASQAAQRVEIINQLPPPPEAPGRVFGASEPTPPRPSGPQGALPMPTAGEPASGSTAPSAQVSPSTPKLPVLPSNTIIPNHAPPGRLVTLLLEPQNPRSYYVVGHRLRYGEGGREVLEIELLDPETGSHRVISSKEYIDGLHGAKQLGLKPGEDTQNIRFKPMVYSPSGAFVFEPGQAFVIRIPTGGKEHRLVLAELQHVGHAVGQEGGAPQYVFREIGSGREHVVDSPFKLVVRPLVMQLSQDSPLIDTSRPVSITIRRADGSTVEHSGNIQVVWPTGIYLARGGKIQRITWGPGDQVEVAQKGAVRTSQAQPAPSGESAAGAAEGGIGTGEGSSQQQVSGTVPTATIEEQILNRLISRVASADQPVQRSRYHLDGTSLHIDLVSNNDVAGRQEKLVTRLTMPADAQPLGESVASGEFNNKKVADVLSLVVERLRALGISPDKIAVQQFEESPRSMPVLSRQQVPGYDATGKPIVIDLSKRDYQVIEREGEPAAEVKPRLGVKTTSVAPPENAIRIIGQWQGRIVPIGVGQEGAIYGVVEHHYREPGKSDEILIIHPIGAHERENIVTTTAELIDFVSTLSADYYPIAPLPTASTTHGVFKASPDAEPQLMWLIAAHPGATDLARRANAIPKTAELLLMQAADGSVYMMPTDHWSVMEELANASPDEKPLLRQGEQVIYRGRKYNVSLASPHSAVIEPVEGSAPYVRVTSRDLPDILVSSLTGDPNPLAPDIAITAQDVKTIEDLTSAASTAPEGGAEGEVSKPTETGAETRAAQPVGGEPASETGGKTETGEPERARESVAQESEAQPLTSVEPQATEPAAEEGRVASAETSGTTSEERATPTPPSEPEKATTKAEEPAAVGPAGGETTVEQTQSSEGRPAVEESPVEPKPTSGAMAETEEVGRAPARGDVQETSAPGGGSVVSVSVLPPGAVNVVMLGKHPLDEVTESGSPPPDEGIVTFHIVNDKGRPLITAFDDEIGDIPRPSARYPDPAGAKEKIKLAGFISYLSRDEAVVARPPAQGEKPHWFKFNPRLLQAAARRARNFAAWLEGAIRAAEEWEESRRRTIDEARKRVSAGTGGREEPGASEPATGERGETTARGAEESPQAASTDTSSSATSGATQQAAAEQAEAAEGAKGTPESSGVAAEAKGASESTQEESGKGQPSSAEGSGGKPTTSVRKWSAMAAASGGPKVRSSDVLRRAGTTVEVRVPQRDGQTKTYTIRWVERDVRWRDSKGVESSGSVLVAEGMPAGEAEKLADAVALARTKMIAMAARGGLDAEALLERSYRLDELMDIAVRAYVGDKKDTLLDLALLMRDAPTDEVIRAFFDELVRETELNTKYLPGEDPVSLARQWGLSYDVLVKSPIGILGLRDFLDIWRMSRRIRGSGYNWSTFTDIWREISSNIESVVNLRSKWLSNQSDVEPAVAGVVLRDDIVKDVADRKRAAMQHGADAVAFAMTDEVGSGPYAGSLLRLGVLFDVSVLRKHNLIVRKSGTLLRRETVKELNDALMAELKTSREVEVVAGYHADTLAYVILMDRSAGKYYVMRSVPLEFMAGLGLKPVRIAVAQRPVEVGELFTVKVAYIWDEKSKPNKPLAIATVADGLSLMDLLAIERAGEEVKKLFPDAPTQMALRFKEIQERMLKLAPEYLAADTMAKAEPIRRELDALQREALEIAKNLNIKDKDVSLELVPAAHAPNPEEYKQLVLEASEAARRAAQIQQEEGYLPVAAWSGYTPPEWVSDFVKRALRRVYIAELARNTSSGVLSDVSEPVRKKLLIHATVMDQIGPIVAFAPRGRSYNEAWKVLAEMFGFSFSEAFDIETEPTVVGDYISMPAPIVGRSMVENSLLTYYAGKLGEGELRNSFGEVFHARQKRKDYDYSNAHGFIGVNTPAYVIPADPLFNRELLRKLDAAILAGRMEPLGAGAIIYPATSPRLLRYFVADVMFGETFNHRSRAVNPMTVDEITQRVAEALERVRYPVPPDLRDNVVRELVQGVKEGAYYAAEDGTFFAQMGEMRSLIWRARAGTLMASEIPGGVARVIFEDLKKAGLLQEDELGQVRLANLTKEEQAPLPSDTVVSASVASAASSGNRSREGIRQAKTVEAVHRDLATIRPEWSMGYIFDPKDHQAGPSAINNIRAIRALLEFADEPNVDRAATLVNEMALYRGWGALPRAISVLYTLEKLPTDLREEYTSMMNAAEAGSRHDREAAVTLSELIKDEKERENMVRSVAASVLNAHYTDPRIASAVWKGLSDVRAIGRPINVLEPGSGIGIWLGTQPADMRAFSNWTMIEMEPVAAKIAATLFPSANVINERYERVHVQPQSVDLAVGNVPFGNFKLTDGFDKNLSNMSIHNFFIAKSARALKPGGFMLLITSRFTLDSETNLADLMDRLAESDSFIVDALRLPTGAHQTFAGTAAETDILLVRRAKDKQERAELRMLSRKRFGTVSTAAVPHESNPNNRVEVKLNKFFLDNLDRVVGRHGAGRGRFSAHDYKVIADSVQMAGMYDRIAEWVSSSDVFLRSEVTQSPPLVLSEVHVGRIIQDPQTRSFYQVSLDGRKPYEVDRKDIARLEAMIGLRDTMEQLVEMERDPKSDDRKVEELRSKLSQMWNEFLKKYGRPTTGRNARFLREDPYLSVLAALEVSPLLRQRMYRGENYTGEPEPGTVKNFDDAIAYSYLFHGRIEPDHVAKLMGDPSAIQRIENEMFLDPVTRQWMLPEFYLTGDVISKLEIAKKAAAGDERFKKNVEALEAVIPPTPEPKEMPVTFGAAWLPKEIYVEFLRDQIVPREGADDVNVFVTPMGVVFQAKDIGPSNRAYAILGKTFNSNTELASFLNNTVAYRPITVWEGVEVAGVRRRLVNQEETAFMRGIQSRLREIFPDWFKQKMASGTAPHLEQAVSKAWRDVLRPFRRPVWDPSRLKREWVAGAVLRQGGLDEHQRSAVWAILTRRNMLISHPMGAGKTATMIAAAMALKRAGVISKAAFVVKNNTLSGIVAEWNRLVPDARILVVEASDLDGQKAPATLARIAYGDWDAVIFTYTAFSRVPVHYSVIDQYAKVVEAELQSLLGLLGKEDEDVVSKIKEGRAPRPLKSLINSVQSRIGALMARAEAVRKAGYPLHWHDLGFGQIFVDEAHNFKKMGITTRMQDVHGIDIGASGRAMDLYTKILDLRRNPKAGVVLATGTPITNTMGELYTYTRMLAEDQLVVRNMASFDAWAAAFVEPSPIVIPTPRGYVMRMQLHRWSNGPLLQEWVAGFIHAVDPKSLKVLDVPKIADGEPKAIVVEMTDRQREYMEHVKERYEKIKSQAVKPREDNYLKVFGDALKVSISPNFAVDDMPLVTEGRIVALADKVAEIYHRKSDLPVVQLLFADVGVPDRRGDPVTKTIRQKVVADHDPVTGEIREYVTQTVYYPFMNHIKQELVKRGIPENEIYVVSKDTDARELSKVVERTRRAEIKVLIGSRSKLGEGINLQDYVKAVHHVTIPFRPCDLEQSEARGVRQGNKHKEVEVYYYATRGLMDEAIFQYVRMKAAFIWEFLAGLQAPDSWEEMEISSTLAAVSLAQGLVAADPRVVELTKLEHELRSLESGYAMWKQNVHSAQVSAANLRSALAVYETRLNKITRLANAYKAAGVAEDNHPLFAQANAASRIYRLIVAGEKEKIAELFRYVDVKWVAHRDVDGDGMRSYGVVVTDPVTGFELAFSAEKSHGYVTIEFSIDGTRVASSRWSQDAVRQGVTPHIDDVTKALRGEEPKVIEALRHSIENFKKEIKAWEAVANSAFPNEKRLIEVRRRVEELLSAIAESARNAKGDVPISEGESMPLSEDDALVEMLKEGNSLAAIEEEELDAESGAKGSEAGRRKRAGKQEELSEDEAMARALQYQISRASLGSLEHGERFVKLTSPEGREHWLRWDEVGPGKIRLVSAPEGRVGEVTLASAVMSELLSGEGGLTVDVGDTGASAVLSRVAGLLGGTDVSAGQGKAFVFARHEALDRLGLTGMDRLWGTTEPAAVKIHTRFGPVVFANRPVAKELMSGGIVGLAMIGDTTRAALARLKQLAIERGGEWEGVYEAFLSSAAEHPTVLVVDTSAGSLEHAIAAARHELFHRMDLHEGWSANMQAPAERMLQEGDVAHVVRTLESRLQINGLSPAMKLAEVFTALATGDFDPREIPIPVAASVMEKYITMRRGHHDTGFYPAVEELLDAAIRRHLQGVAGEGGERGAELGDLEEAANPFEEIASLAGAGRPDARSHRALASWWQEKFGGAAGLQDAIEAVKYGKPVVWHSETGRFLRHELYPRSSAEPEVSVLGDTIYVRDLALAPREALIAAGMLVSQHSRVVRYATRGGDKIAVDATALAEVGYDPALLRDESAILYGHEGMTDLKAYMRILAAAAEAKLSGAYAARRPRGQGGAPETAAGAGGGGAAPPKRPRRGRGGAWEQEPPDENPFADWVRDMWDKEETEGQVRRRRTPPTGFDLTDALKRFSDLPDEEIRRMLRKILGKDATERTITEDELLKVMLHIAERGINRLGLSRYAGLVEFIHSPSWWMSRSRHAWEIWLAAGRAWIKQSNMVRRMIKRWTRINHTLGRESRERIAFDRDVRQLLEHYKNVDTVKAIVRHAGYDPGLVDMVRTDTLLSDYERAVSHQWTLMFDHMFRVARRAGVVRDDQRIMDYLPFYREDFLVRSGKLGGAAAALAAELGISELMAEKILRSANTRGGFFPSLDLVRERWTMPDMRDPDMRFSIYVRGWARRVAMAEFAEVANRHYGRIADETIKRLTYDYIQRYTGRWYYQEDPAVIRARTAALTLQYAAKIGGNVFTPLLNLTQLMTNTVARLGFLPTMRGIMQLLTAGVARYMPSLTGGRYTVSAARRRYVALVRAGVMDPWGSKYDLPSAVEATTSMPRRWLTQAAHILGSLHRGSEVINRGATYLAAYDAAIRAQAPPRQARRFAMDTVRDTHFLGGRLDAPLAASRGFWGPVMLQFKTFTFKQIEYMRKMRGPEAARFALMTALLGGPAAFGLTSVVAALAPGSDLAEQMEQWQQAYSLDGWLNALAFRDQLGIYMLPGTEDIGKYGIGERLRQWLVGPTIDSVLRTASSISAGLGGQRKPEYVIYDFLRSWVPGGVEMVRLGRALSEGYRPEDAIRVLSGIESEETRRKHMRYIATHTPQGGRGMGSFGSIR